MNIAANGLPFSQGLLAVQFLLSCGVIQKTRAPEIVTLSQPLEFGSSAKLGSAIRRAG